MVRIAAVTALAFAVFALATPAVQDTQVLKDNGKPLSSDEMKQLQKIDEESEPVVNKLTATFDDKQKDMDKKLADLQKQVGELGEQSPENDKKFEDLDRQINQTISDMKASFNETQQQLDAKLTELDSKADPLFTGAK
ncbi:hypothetical protein HRG_002811 [Hirsutella rhossiliensis]|uniref:Uncharacterized protein n=1 Tax=Hirsutella rhossiliensis TaxID=111463 RepID=A0A9P8N0S1_9HYPO|nr:uncharacterized protein HRG_02811 [Hirsutella rhossiliensis]KAH0964795.1 hypothetical protein HRG_02811 [Hirsutella rhossiliensis]